MKRILIIGCGPAGIASALYAAGENTSVTILDHMEKGGKKLLLTGNGRCNLCNDNLCASGYNSSETDFVQDVLNTFGYNELLRFFDTTKIHIKSKNGYIYPANEQALSVWNRLETSLKDKKIKLKYNQTVKEIRKEYGVFLVVTESYTYEADCLILACGGASYPQTGSDGSGYELAEKLGHNIIPYYPSLTALKAEDVITNSCAGVRCDAHATLFVDGQPIKTSEGELQITKGYLSGIIIYELSSQAVKSYKKGQKIEIHINFLPEICDNSCLTFEDFETLVNNKILNVLKNSTDADLLCNKMKDYVFEITGYKGFDYAQVTGGGVDIKEINSKTMESRLVKDLYFAGEMIDVDGICGGYNLSFAFATGAIAGMSAKKED